MAGAARGARPARSVPPEADHSAPGLPTFGALLKRHRRAAGLSQEDLAERTAYSVGYISKLERSARRPIRATAELLLDALGLTAASRDLLLRTLHTPSLMPVPVGPSLAAPPLVGRANELARLETFLEGEGGSVMLVEGEPGIGKTRLLREAAHRGADAGWTVLEGGCQRRSGQEPYAPLIGALLACVGQVPTARLRELLEGCAWMVRLVPEILERVPVPVPAYPLPPDQERRLMFAAVGRFLANAAGPAGTLLVLDDLQWAGPDALDLFGALVRDPAERPLRVVLAARSTEVPPNDELAFLLADLAREAVVERMMLRPLPPEEAARLLGTLLCDTDEAPRSRRDELLRRAGGVPFFLVSGAQGLRAGSDQAIPWDLAQTIRARVVLLPEPAQLLLRVAAVAGRIAPRSMLLAVGHRQGLTDDDAARGLDTACRAGLLEVVGNAARRERMSGAAPDVVVAADAVPPNTASKEDTTTEDATTDGPDADTAPIGVEALAAAHHGPVYTFTHDLIRDAVLDEIGAAQRAHLHGGVAAVLAETAAASHPKILADHYARAGEFELASIFAERAGDAAVGRLAFGDAREQYRIALEHGGPPARRAKLLVKAAEVLVVLTLYDTAMGALCSASALYGDLGQRGDPDAWEHQARTEARIGQAHAVRGTTFDGIGRLRAYIAGWPNPEGAKGVQAALELALADLYFEVSWYQEELAAAERAAAYAHQAGDEPTAIRAETRRATAYMSLGRTVDGKALLESLIPRAEHVDPHILTHVLNNAADTAIETGNFGQASAFSKRAGDAARRAGDPVLTAYTQYRLGVLAYFEGHWNEAHNHIEKAIELTTELRDSARVASVLVGAGRLLMAEGKTERAEAYFARGTGHGERAGDLHVVRMAQTVRAERDLLEGRPEGARRRLAPLGDRGGQREADVTEFMPLLAWAYLDLGEREEAERIAAESVARARDQQVALALLDAWRIQALVLSRCDGGVEAVRQLRRVALLCANMPYPYGEAKALYVHGLVLLREGELEAARARLGAARAILERLGEGLYAPHVERALAEANRG